MNIYDEGVWVPVLGVHSFQNDIISLNHVSCSGLSTGAG